MFHKEVQMVGLKIETEDLNRMRQLGYHLIEDDMKTYIIDQNEKKIAEIVLDNKRALL